MVGDLRIPQTLSRATVGVLLVLFGLLDSALMSQDAPGKEPQYAVGEIKVPAAHANEQMISKFSTSRALSYLDDGAVAWSENYQCISCHTNGSYLAIRSSMAEYVGQPKPEIREFFVERMGDWEKEEGAKLMSGVVPTQLAYLAWSLAEWDKHVAKNRSDETDRAIKLLMKSQSADGAFGNDKCWPPLESSDYHGATVAGMACASAPGWIADNQGTELGQQYEKTVEFLKKTKPQNDYGVVLKLWASSRIEGLVEKKEKSEILEMIFSHQKEDGGWAMRDFSTPENWGDGIRAKKLRAEPGFKNPASDGHQTGLCVLVLREAGVPADDTRIKKAVKWILNNQRESGRWWTRSMNTDGSHYITYSGTCYPLAALAKCGQLDLHIGKSDPAKK